MHYSMAGYSRIWALVTQIILFMFVKYYVKHYEFVFVVLCKIVILLIA